MKSDLKPLLDELSLLIKSSKMSAPERREIQGSLERLAVSLSDDSVDSSELASTIYSGLLKLQQEHPVLTKTMNQVAETLGQMGI